MEILDTRQYYSQMVIKSRFGFHYLHKHKQETFNPTVKMAAQTQLASMKENNLKQHALNVVWPAGSLLLLNCNTEFNKSS